MTNEDMDGMWQTIQGIVAICGALQNRVDALESEVRELRQLEGEADAAIVQAIGTISIDAVGNAR